MSDLLLWPIKVILITIDLAVSKNEWIPVESLEFLRQSLWRRFRFPHDLFPSFALSPAYSYYIWLGQGSF